MIFGYCRVSTTEQASAGTTSLEEQERVIRGYAMAKGVTAFDLQIFVDAGVSGSIPLHLRLAGGEMIDQLKTGDIVVASKLDRIFRNSLDALKTYTSFKEKGIHLVLFDLGIEPVTGDSGMSKVIFQVMSAFADHERERIRERVLDGKRAKKAKGGHTGGEAPFGWKIVGSSREARLEPNEDEQKVIQEVLALKDRPLITLTRQINNKGLVSRSGKPFQPVQVQRILTRNEHAVY
jgi:putative DNA-invertase from lambdoid prophage Rac